MLKLKCIRGNAIIKFVKFEFAGKTYEMDEAGNIKSLYKTKTGFLKTFPDKDGYLKLAVTDTNRKTHNAFIHRLVYQTWIGDIPEGMSVDHIDGDKTNNHVNNLQLLTPEENAVKGDARVWRFISPEGIPVEIYNLKAFCRQNNLHKSHMYSVHNEHPSYKQYKGWRKYYE